MQLGFGNHVQVVLGVVAFVEDERDVADALRQLTAPLGDLGDHVAEGGRVVLIAGVAVVQQRHVSVGSDQQRQTDDAQVVASLLAMPSLRESGSQVEAVDEGEEVGSVEKQAVEVQTKAGDGCLGQLALDAGNSVCVHAAHVVPEALTAELRGANANQPWAARSLVPGGQTRLAAGGQAPVEGRDEQVLTDGRSACPAFG